MSCWTHSASISLRTSTLYPSGRLAYNFIFLLELFSFYLICSSVLFLHFCVIVGILQFPTWFLQWPFHLQFLWICMFSVASLTFDFHFYSFIVDRLQKKQFHYHVFVDTYCASCTRNSSIIMCLLTLAVHPVLETVTRGVQVAFSLSTQ